MPLMEVYLPYQTDQLYCIILSLPPRFPSGPVGQLSSPAPLQLKETLEPAVKKQYLGDRESGNDALNFGPVFPSEFMGKALLRSDEKLCLGIQKNPEGKSWAQAHEAGKAGCGSTVGRLLFPLRTSVCCL